MFGIIIHYFLLITCIPLRHLHLFSCVLRCHRLAGVESHIQESAERLRIPDPNSLHWIDKIFNFFNPKFFYLLCSRKSGPGCLSRIRFFYHPKTRIRSFSSLDHGQEFFFSQLKGSGFRIQIRYTELTKFLIFLTQNFFTYCALGNLAQDVYPGSGFFTIPKPGSEVFPAWITVRSFFQSRVRSFSIPDPDPRVKTSLDWGFQHRLSGTFFSHKKRYFRC